jgi:hypothetical protein
MKFPIGTWLCNPADSNVWCCENSESDYHEGVYELENPPDLTPKARPLIMEDIVVGTTFKSKGCSTVYRIIHIADAQEVCLSFIGQYGFERLKLESISHLVHTDYVLIKKGQS